MGAFGAFGIIWGAFAVLLTDLSRFLDLSPGPLGVALSVGMVASFPAMVLGGRAADRFGRRALLLVSGSLLGVGFAWLAFVGGYAALFVVLLVLSAASGVYDVGINAAAMDLERTTGRRFMAVLHAAFSAGGAAGALISGALISVGVDFRHVYLVALIPLGAVILAVTTTRFPPKEEGAAGTSEGERAGLYKNLPLLLVALIAALVFLSEGAMEHWSGIYLRGTLELPALLGASGVAVFHASMAVGRLGAAETIRRFGDRPTLRATGLLATGGMVLALATREPLLVVAGFLVVGLALSAVAPITFSFAGELVPDRAGGASSVVTTFGYSGFLLGPVTIGGVAELTSLRIALGIVAVAGLLIFTLSLRIRGQQKTESRVP